MGGKIAGDAKRELEKKSGNPVTSKANFLDQLNRGSVEVNVLKIEKDNKSTQV